MIKYLVMGIRQLINKNPCTGCGKEIPKHWKVCDDCDYKSFRNVWLRKQIRIEKSKLNLFKRIQEKPLIYKYKNYATIDPEIILKASILITDDMTGKVIGYKL